MTVEPAAGGSPETIQADAVLVSIGRVPYTEGLGLEHVGVQKDNKGRILTDAHFATNVTGIYAIGDVIAGPMLAHKAEDEGVAVAEILAGQRRPRELRRDPERGLHVPGGRLGRQDRGGAEAGRRRLQGRQVSVHGQRPRQGQPDDGRLRQDPGRCDDRPGARRPHHRAEAGNLDHGVAVAMEFGASSEDIARTCHAHPTLSEAVKEAALAVEKRAIHM